MSRLTRKYEDNSGYTPVVNHPVRKEITLFDFEEQDYDCCVEKLGKIEDIMEYFKINSIDQLINILEAWYVVKPSIHHIKEQRCFVIHNLYRNEQYNFIKKGLEI